MRWRAVRRLQRVLVRSFSAKCLAVLRVTENRGRKTPGVDGVTWNTPEAKSDAVRALGKRDYRPQPLRRIYIPITSAFRARQIRTMRGTLPAELAAC
jgi:RNA-directed DNA polymerase